MRIGIPRSLAYYKYFPLWQGFFEDLGVEVIFSPPTNRLILDQGIKSVVDEACLPVKVYFGHIQYLKDKADYIFAPRLVSVTKKEYTCPKFMGIPDMLLSNIPNLPQIIGPTIDLTKQNKNLWRKIWEVGNLFSSSPLKISLAWQKGLKNLKAYQRNFYLKKFPQELQINYEFPKQKSLKVMVIGHEYIIYDQFLSMHLIEKLANLNVEVRTIEMLPEKIINKQVSHLPKRIFWDFAKNSLGSVFYYSKKEDVSGFILMSSFACGPDSMIGSMVEHYLKDIGNKPLLNLTIDEHTGEAGINTRLEAFYDLLIRRAG